MASITAGSAAVLGSAPHGYLGACRWARGGGGARGHGVSVSRWGPGEVPSIVVGLLRSVRVDVPVWLSVNHAYQWCARDFAII